MNSGVWSIIRAMRVHQWVKNTLLFVPLILSHNLFNPEMFSATLTAFFAFSLCASSIYIINDIVDLESDRLHPTKCKRPFAAGQLSINSGIILATLLFISSIIVAYFVSWSFVIVLLCYLAITSLYSFLIKRVALLDVLLLAGLYTFRLLAGSIAANVPISFWLLVFSVFIFFSLALVKRYSELFNIDESQQASISGRGYQKSDMPLLLNLGIVSGYLSVLVLGLYIHDSAVVTHYSVPEWLWLVVASVLFWISSIWMVTFRGGMNEDPVLYAIHDRSSLLVMMICVLSIVMAL